MHQMRQWPLLILFSDGCFNFFMIIIKILLSANHLLLLGSSFSSQYAAKAEEEKRINCKSTTATTIVAKQWLHCHDVAAIEVSIVYFIFGSD